MRKIAVRLAISLLSLIFFLGVLEIGLRVAGYLYYKKVSSVIGSSDVVSNSLKILCIGDSYTVGGQGLKADAYPNQLRSTLFEEFGDKFNVVNGGICEINSTQALMRLSELSKGYSPDYVILLVGSANKFNLRGFSEYEQGKKNIFANLRVYKMFKILKTNLKGEFLKWRMRQYGSLTNKEGIGQEIQLQQESQPEKDLIAKVSVSDKPLENKAAEKEYKKAIKDNPRNGYGYVKLARLYRNQNDSKKAEELYKKSVEINPNQELFYIELGDYYCQQEKFKEAIQMYKKTIELNPKNDRVYTKLANQYRDYGKFKEAEDAYKKAIAINPQGSWTYIELGHCYRAESKFSQSQEAYQKGIELDPTQSWAYTGLGASYSEQGKLKEAEAAYKEAIKVDPDNVWARMDLGNYYLGQGRLKDAQDMHEKTIDIDPEQGWAYVGLANCYLEQGQFKDAVSFYQKAIELDPTEARSYLGLANCYREQRKFKKAEKLYKKAIELAPYKTWVYTRLAEFYGRLDRIEEAKEMLIKAIELDPSDSKIYGDLAKCYGEQREFKEAERLFKKAIELGSKDGWVYIDLGKIYVEQAEYSLAFESFCKGIESNPGDFDLYYDILKAYELQGTYGLGRLLEAFQRISEKNPALGESPEFRNYIKLCKNKEKWEKKINKWLNDDLEAIAEFCRENNIKLIVQSYPYPYIAVNKSLEDLALKYSLPFVDNYSIFKELVEKEGREKYFFDSDHCTPKGHVIMVENIYRVLVSEGIVKDDKDRVQ